MLQKVLSLSQHIWTLQSTLLQCIFLTDCIYCCELNCSWHKTYWQCSSAWCLSCKWECCERCSAVRSRHLSCGFVDILWQAVVGGNSLQSWGVCDGVSGADVFVDWHRRICHPRHFHCRMLCHCQPQPTLPYAGLFQRLLIHNSNNNNSNTYARSNCIAVI